MSRHVRWCSEYRDILDSVTIALSSADPALYDLDILDALADAGYRARRLYVEIDSADTCGCPDPGCPCGGEKRGPP